MVVERIHPSEWILYAQLELHFQYELKEQLDQAQVNIKINGLFIFEGILKDFQFKIQIWKMPVNKW